MSVDILTGEDSFLIFKNEMIFTSRASITGEFPSANQCIPVLLDRDVLIERTPDVSEEIPNYQGSGATLLRLPFPASMSSENQCRYGKKILFPAGELVIIRERTFAQESLPCREWIMREVPYALLMSIYDIQGNLENTRLENLTVLYKNKKVLAEETFYNKTSVIFRGQIHLNWDERVFDLYNRFCSRYKSVYEKGSLLQELNVSLEEFLEVFKKNFSKLEEIISILH